MSERNGDKARFQKNRQRKLLNRQRIRELIAKIAPKPAEDGSDASTRASSRAMQEKGEPTRDAD